MVEPDVSMDFSYDPAGNITAITVRGAAGTAEGRFCEAFSEGLEAHRAYPRLIEEGLFFYNRSFHEIPSVGVWVDQEKREKIKRFFSPETKYVCVAFEDSFMITTTERGFQLQFDPIEA